MKQQTQGFTLIELLIVIAIIAVLAAILIPTFRGAQKRPYDVAAVQCNRAVFTALITTRAATGSYPTNVSALGEDVAEACAQQGVRVREYGGGRPNAGDAGDGSILLNGTTFAYWTWHPKGSAAYYTSPDDGLRIARNAF